MQKKSGIPVIDLFAGPGGLCEGFASLVRGGSREFDIRVSIEKDPVAHRTLSLRALFRSFPIGRVPASYYQYIRGEISREQLESDPEVRPYVEKAYSEARCAELGKDDHSEIDAWIREGLAGAKEWVLIGGPPCQAYSLAGRARMRGGNPKEFEADKRHFLYREYLRVIKDFSPSIFVMENVKGMLTSQHSGSPIFDRILNDLRSPGNGYQYLVRSFVVPGEIQKPDDFVIESEKYGIPQSRHRVILFGIRADLARAVPDLTKRPERFSLKQAPRMNANEVLAGLPSLRSKLSHRQDGIAYLKNMQLSQERTRSTLEYLLGLQGITDRTDWVIKRVTANGLSSSRADPKNQTGAHNQRVEFRIVTTSDERMSELARQFSVEAK